MKINWKFLSISLIISIIIHGIVGSYIYLNIMNLYSKAMNAILIEYTELWDSYLQIISEKSFENITYAKSSTTIASAPSQISPLVGIGLISASFIIVTLICYVGINFYYTRKK